MKRIFLTGATGYLGCHLAYRFLAEGHRVIALVRAQEEESPQERLVEAVTRVGSLSEEQLSRLTAVSGTVQESPEQIAARYRHLHGQTPIDEIWHSAAIFNFKPREKEKVKAVNIQGSRNILNFALIVNSTFYPRFFYISTAYCVGRENNTAVPETIPHHIDDFRSLYEWSKHYAEKSVQHMQHQHQLDAFVIRPSIIVGTPQSQVTCASGYYQVMAECSRLRDTMIKKMAGAFDGNVQTRLLGDPTNPLNLVPIDFVVDAMILLAQNNQLKKQTLKVFNLVNEAPPTIGTVQEAVTSSLNINGLDLVSQSDFDLEPMTAVEQKINRRISFQAPYMHEEIRFLTSCFRKYVSKDALPPPSVDVDYLKRLNKIFLSDQEK